MPDSPQKLTRERVIELLTLRGPGGELPVSDSRPPARGPARFGRAHPRGLTAAEAVAVEDKWKTMSGRATWMHAFFTFLAGES